MNPKKSTKLTSFACDPSHRLFNLPTSCWWCWSVCKHNTWCMLIFVCKHSLHWECIHTSGSKNNFFYRIAFLRLSFINSSQSENLSWLTIFLLVVCPFSHCLFSSTSSSFHTQKKTLSFSLYYIFFHFFTEKKTYIWWAGEKRFLLEILTFALWKCSY